jgi:endonuclease YncB( thermonuclease family)
MVLFIDGSMFYPLFDVTTLDEPKHCHVPNSKYCPDVAPSQADQGGREQFGQAMVVPKMSKLQPHLASLFAALIATANLHQAFAQNDISGFAHVGNDGSMEIGGDLIHLYGIYVPPTDQTCYTFIRPMPCGTRAALALEFKISGDFVHCTERFRQTDGSITASCRAGDDDLSEFMLQRGWAVALPDAPFQYVAMERIAREKGIGIWGIPVDVIRRR